MISSLFSPDLRYGFTSRMYLNWKGLESVGSLCKPDKHVVGVGHLLVVDDDGGHGVEAVTVQLYEPETAGVRLRRVV